MEGDVEPPYTVVEEGEIGDRYYYAITLSKRMGHHCGYIAVPPDHPWYGKDYNDVDCDVHGGLTYGEASQYGKEQEKARLLGEIADLTTSEEHTDPQTGITFPSMKPLSSLYERKLAMEMEKQGEWRDHPVPLPADVWWFGFDCGHIMDRQPGMEKLDAERGWEPIIYPGATWKNRDYVMNEIEGMVRQATVAMQVKEVLDRSD